MINTTNEFKKACNSSSIKYREYIILKGTNEKIDVVTEIYKTAYKDTHFIGTFNLGYVKFKTENNIDYKKKEFSLYKEVNNMPLYMGNYIVTEVKDNNSKEEVEVTAFDYGIKFANPYKSELNYASGTVKLFDVLKECCTKCNMILKNTSIENGNFIVDSNQFPNSTYGDVISAIAQISGNFATINNENQLEFIFKTQTNEIIEDYTELLDKRDTKPITTVILGNENIQGQEAIRKDFDLISKYGEHFLIINDNPFAYTTQKREVLVDEIFNKVKGFEYSAFESKYAFKPYLSLGDLIQFRNKEGKLVKSIILETNSKYDDITLIAKSITDAEVKYQNPKNALELAKKAEIMVNQNTGEIQSVVQQIGDRSDKKTTVTQDIEKIQSEISNIADITTSGEGFAQIMLENVAKGEPIRLEIQPNTKDISEVYPSDKLYPSNTLFLPTLKVIFESEKYTTYYTLPADLLWLNENVYDKFILDYETRKCYIEKKVGLNSQGEKFELIKPERVDYEYPTIVLEEGNYKVYLECFDNSFLIMRAVAQNIYTDQFATKVELSSSIKQSADEINLEVRKKVDENEIISAINQSAEQIQISANKIDIDGKAVHFKTEINRTIGLFTQDDLTKIQQYFTGQIELTTEEFRKYDITKDNQVTPRDYLYIKKAVQNDGYYTFNGTFEIDPYSETSNIKLTRKMLSGGEEQIFNFSLLNNYLNNITIGELNIKDSLSPTGLISYAEHTLKKDNPIGHIRIEESSQNPFEYLGFGTWEEQAPSSAFPYMHIWKRIN